MPTKKKIGGGVGGCSTFFGSAGAAEEEGGEGGEVRPAPLARTTRRLSVWTTLRA